MSNEEKAKLYDAYVADAGLLERKNSKLKSDNTINMSADVRKQIGENQKRIDYCSMKLNELVNTI